MSVAKRVLKLPLCENARYESGAKTIGGYLQKLLRNVWVENEGFSGKRPFGNSGWDYDLYESLIRGGYVSGAFDADGYLDDFDQTTADKLILDAIDALFEEPA